jgi:GTP1/Obg family GTP-binding protein
VADQIKILTRFLYLLGGVSKGIEAADQAVRRNEASSAVMEQTEKSKATVKTSLENVREGLDKLEIDFRTTPDLQRYYTSLAGVAAGAANAEDQASAGHYDQAGRSLLDVVNRLTDVLLEMR